MVTEDSTTSVAKTIMRWVDPADTAKVCICFSIGIPECKDRMSNSSRPSLS
eukprot:CAMPEP_0204196584 /NCGR_PEP_ID=MMETSP0361-20130328/63935_1 /ASSEMBLY_ACC=CAM_ASM_000343 /TAXON_ID=268821 /ORGANISM="Scrippsiella Hangoei, Strain SHTV-5" /LENGTH=50 /DNA_ID=CAMNT_0051158357 /DNA_START=78 /DNA_END=227 /DNA_ORIENTATION=+